MIEETRASFAGFHGEARPWLRENSILAREPTHRLGYRLRPIAITRSGEGLGGEPAVTRLEWKNVGVAPLYSVRPADPKRVECRASGTGEHHEFEDGPQGAVVVSEGVAVFEIVASGVGAEAAGEEAFDTLVRRLSSLGAVEDEAGGGEEANVTVAVAKAAAVRRLCPGPRRLARCVRLRAPRF